MKLSPLKSFERSFSRTGTLSCPFTMRTCKCLGMSKSVEQIMVSDRINMIEMIAQHVVDHVNPVFNRHCIDAELGSGKKE